MTQATQELPPWLTAVFSTFTNANGQLTTSTDILQLPLTYYGPSIPLGTNWVYGGSVSPTATPSASSTTVTTPSTTTSANSSSTAPPSSTFTPTSTSSPSSSSVSSGFSSSSGTLTSAPTSSATPSLSSSGSESSSTSPSSTQSDSSSSSASATPTSSGGNGLSTRELAAIGTGAAAGFVLLVVLLFLSWCLYRRHRRARTLRPASSGRTWVGLQGPLSMTFNSSNTSYVVLADEAEENGAVGGRRPGEGSPRHSGDEGDTLLRPSGSINPHARKQSLNEKGLYDIRPVPPAARSGTATTRGSSTVWAVNAAGTQQVFLRHSDGSEKQATNTSGSTQPAMTEAERLREFQDQDQARIRAIIARVASPPPPPETVENENEDAPLLPPRIVTADSSMGLGLMTQKRNSTPMSFLGLAPQVSRNSGTSSFDASNPPRVMSARRVHLSEEFGAPGTATASPVRMPVSLQVQSSSSSSTAHPPTTQDTTPRTPSSWNPLPALPGGLSRFSALSWLKGDQTPLASPSSPVPPSPMPSLLPTAPRHWLSRTPSRNTQPPPSLQAPLPLLPPLPPRTEQRGLPDETGTIGIMGTARSRTVNTGISSLSSHPAIGTISSHNTQATYTTAQTAGTNTTGGTEQSFTTALSPTHLRSSSQVHLGVPTEAGVRPLSHASTVSGMSGSYASAHESPVGSQNSRVSGRHTPASQNRADAPTPPAIPAAVAQAYSSSTDRTVVPPAISTVPSSQTARTLPADAPPAYEFSTSPYTPQMPVIDLLDLPAPSPFSTFSSTASSTAPRPRSLQLPPGLSSIPKPRVWEDIASSAGARTSGSESDDLLDVEPPRAGDVWRSLAEARERGRRATPALPMLVHQHDPRASVHLSDASSYELPSTFSGGFLASVSRAASPAGVGSTGSSRPSRISNLSHQQSISEDGRRGWLATRTTAGEVPLTVEGAASLTAFGQPPAEARVSQHVLAPRMLSPIDPSVLSGPRRSVKDDTANAS